MRKLIYLSLIALVFAVNSYGRTLEERSLDEIKATLEASASTQGQEKVYVHLDNNCYFLGDTIWYKAYVVRADDLNYTDMSRILYVELLNADGLLVERQNLIISSKGFGAGNFCLDDSLYTGYYEIRAYTRWMLNFNVSEHRFSRQDRLSFYSTQMAKDYYRLWDGLYSRVFPVYAAPEEPGDFTYKRIYTRPKQRITKQKKQSLEAEFFPEGGNLIKGVPCSVAFELTDQLGQAVKLSGVVKAGDQEVASISTTYMGRGQFTVTPTDKRLEAYFTYGDKEYSFKLPKAEDEGVALIMEGTNIVNLSSVNLPTDRKYGLSVLCRGVLQHFQELTFDASGKARIELPSLPTGVNDITVFDTYGQVLADRLVFVNNHDYGDNVVNIESGKKVNYAPYEHISLGLKCEGVSQPTLMSISVRDTRTDDPSYDTGDMMTDLLLGSELKGFVANAAYYFESDDDAHKEALDLLMKVQGWRKYKWKELSDTLYNYRRYTPEQTLTVEGGVYKVPSINPVDPAEMVYWKEGQGLTGRSSEDDDEEEEEETESDTYEVDPFDASDITNTDGDTDTSISNIEFGDISDVNIHLEGNHGGLRKEVLLEAEISVGKESAGLVQKTDNGGHFLFQIPPFYGYGYLKMKAYNEKDSVKMNMASRSDKHALDETAFPDYYVKRDLFYPMFTTKYNYYQDHAPDYVPPAIDEDELSELSMENEDHLLQNIDVKGRRKGRRAIDYSKPAYAVDAYSIYNEITDRGLSYGVYDMRTFPVQVCKYLFGNMGRHVSFNVNGRYDSYTYYRNYAPNSNDPSLTLDNKNVQAFYNNLLLKRLKEVRVFTDYEPRNEDSTMEHSKELADVVVEFKSFEDNASQPTFRDRHILIQGIFSPMEFYNPDYSNKELPEVPTDYRRTLYWNPNAVTDEEGRFNASFYNNSKETRIKISAAGITGDGKIITTGK